MRMHSKLLPLAAAIALLSASKVAGAIVKRSASALDGTAVRDARGHLDDGLERRETLADVCGRKGNMCLRISSNMFTPDTESFTGSEKQPDGSILLLVDNAGGSGRAQCGNDIVRWSLNSREKTYDGRSLNGDRNERIRGYFTSDPNKSTIHFVLKTTADADLVMSCSGSTLADRSTLGERDSLEHRESLADHCATEGVQCLKIGPQLYVPSAKGVTGSETQPDGSILLLLNDVASGTAQCGSSAIAFNMQRTGEKVFDGRLTETTHNERITGYFSNDPSKKSIDGVIKSTVVGADLLLTCGSGDDSILARDSHGNGVQLE